MDKNQTRKLNIMLSTIQEVDAAIKNNDVSEPAYKFKSSGIGASISFHQVFGTKTAIAMVNVLSDGKLGSYLEPKSYMKFMNLIEFSMEKMYNSLTDVPGFYYARLIPKGLSTSAKATFELPEGISTKLWNRRLEAQKMFVIESDKIFYFLEDLSRDTMQLAFKEVGIDIVVFSIQTETHYLKLCMKPSKL